MILKGFRGASPVIYKAVWKPLSPNTNNSNYTSSTARLGGVLGCVRILGVMTSFVDLWCMGVVNGLFWLDSDDDAFVKFVVIVKELIIEFVRYLIPLNVEFVIYVVLLTIEYIVI